jgi:hypothetical protein
MLPLRLSLRSGRPNTLFKRQSIVRYRSQIATVTRRRLVRRLRSAVKDVLPQIAEQASTRPNQETSTRPTERQRHGQSTSWSLCTDTELYTGSYMELYTESTDMEHISAEL